MADDATAQAAAPAQAPAYATEAALRTAIVGYLTQAQDAITAGASLFPKSLPQDLYQLQVSLGLRIKSLPIASS